jgi:hypothetical protein
MLVRNLMLFSATSALIASAALAQTQDQNTTKTQSETTQPAQITVQQPPAQVQVRQGQPEIFVHQPAPHIVVEIPQPQITVRMPQVQAQVKQEAPQVQVVQPQPKVQVAQPEQSQVQVQSQGQPQIRYDMEQPKVEVRQAEGQPTVRFEQMQAGTTDQTSTTVATTQQKNLTTTDQNKVTVASKSNRLASDIQASKLINTTVYSVANENIGDIKDVVIGRDGKVYGVIIGVGGFLGLGEKDVLVPLDRIEVVRDDNNNLRYVITVSRQELEGAPAFDRKTMNYANQ